MKKVFESLGLDSKEYEFLIQTPRDTNVCDVCIPCFSLAKIMKENPVKIAEKIANEFNLLASKRNKCKSLKWICKLLI